MTSSRLLSFFFCFFKRLGIELYIDGALQEYIIIIIIIIILLINLQLGCGSKPPQRGSIHLGSGMKFCSENAMLIKVN